jgi:hypothetical protein
MVHWLILIILLISTPVLAEDVNKKYTIVNSSMGDYKNPILLNNETGETWILIRSREPKHKYDVVQWNPIFYKNGDYAGTNPSIVWDQMNESKKEQGEK